MVLAGPDLVECTSWGVAWGGAKPADQGTARSDAVMQKTGADKQCKHLEADTAATACLMRFCLLKFDSFSLVSVG
jgi:hypothetical protein